MASYNFDKKDETKKEVDSNATSQPNVKKSRFRIGRPHYVYRSAFSNSSRNGIIFGAIIVVFATLALVLFLTITRNVDGYALINATITRIEYSYTISRDTAYVTFTTPDSKTYKDVEVDTFTPNMHVGDKIKVYYYIEDPNKMVKVINGFTSIMPIVISSVFLAAGSALTIYSTVKFVKEKKTKKEEVKIDNK